MQIFCFSYAGGSSYAFRPLVQVLAPEFEAVALEYPGRGSRIQAPLCDDIQALVDDMTALIRPQIQGRFAFFGHSMGAVIAYLVARKLAASDGPKPAHLFLSGRRGLVNKKGTVELHALSREDFWKTVADFGGAPAEVLADEGIKEFFEPILRTDFQVIEQYRPAADTSVDVPATLLIGADDPTLPEPEWAWSEVCTQSVTTRTYPGGHFYWMNELTNVAADIRAILQSASAG